MNELTQTLFRFISMRAPQLSDEEGKDLRFIYYPEDNVEKSNFYTAVIKRTAGETKKSALEKEALSFTPLTKQEIKDIAPPLFELAEWLARNRATYNGSEVWESLNDLTPIEDTVTLWDNLFYQMITQNDFYAKEAIIQFLVANHVLNNYNREDIGEVESAEELERQRRAILDVLLYAKVILPAALFSEDNSESTEAPSDIKIIYFQTPEHIEKKVKDDIASFKLKQVKHVKKELEQLKLAYKEAYKQEYKTQEKAHGELIKPILSKYKQQLKENQLIEKTSEIEYPELPEFEFTFRSEIDTKTAKEDLSKSTYRVLSALQPLEKIKTFKQAEKLLAQKEKELTATVFKSKTFSKKTVSVKGTIVSATKAMPVIGDGSKYVLVIQAETTGLDNWTWEYYLDLTTQTENVAIQGITYGLSFDNGEEGPSGIAYQVINTTGTTQIQVRLFSDLPVLQLNSDYGIPTISGTIHLLNGDTLDFSYKLNPDSSIILPYPYEEEGGEDGGEGGLGEEEEEEGDVPTEGIFTPSGYGMRQLGIADYRKVEQSVHCYLEGEVSHIENVMAREYKEKSSRRLRRSENTISSTSETEKERLTDTTTTNRFEMQNEVSQVLSESKDHSVYADLHYGGKAFGFNTGANYASHTSKEDSVFQAVTQAQEITARAMDRVVQKVKEERITKIIEEFEENNKHGFDNRKGSKHVIGVYRWIDKIYKNQIYNYGKRLMYEFVIPQPSKLHRLALTEIAENDTTTLLEQPIDPRTMGLDDADTIAELDYRYWAAMYNAEVSAPPDRFIHISKAFSDRGTSGNYLTEGNANYAGAIDFSVEIPENYNAVSYTGRFGYSYVHSGREGNTNGAVSIGDNVHTINYGIDDHLKERYENLLISGSLSGSQQSVGIGFHGGDVAGMTISVEIQCQRTDQSFEQWKNETFNTIIIAYEDKLAEYHAQIEQEQAKAASLREANPLFYRQIEQTILRKNCISYMIDQNTEADSTYGQQMYSGDTLETYQVGVTQELDHYASFAQFIEQAFEWEIMSYKFYPFYWGNRQEWRDLYQYENNDPLYRNFMQAGLARVVVTVRPGFEDAVMHYMATGNVWNGGLLPVLEDPLYLAIVDELQAPKGEKEGEAWKTRVPTSLTILQADSIGLKVERALPCNCDDIADFQESDQTPCSSEIENDETIFENLQVGDGEVEEEEEEGGGIGEPLV